jgi:hypothetical protein
MSDRIQCDTHGDSQKTYVCKHLLGESFGLGFNRRDPTPKNPFPDAWCDECEIVRAASEGWTEQSERIASISLLCSGCYERARIRNTHTSVTLRDLANLRWKCGSCDEWHTGPALDFGYDSPYHWRKEYAQENDNVVASSQGFQGRSKYFLNSDYCAINDEHFFVRGLIHLPIIGTDDTFRWGVWGSVSQQNFETLLKTDNNPDRVNLPAMFSWLSNKIPEYPDTLNLKMYARVEKPDWRPNFELEPSDHPLSREFHHGVTPQRVREIMLGRLESEHAVL